MSELTTTTSSRKRKRQTRISSPSNVHTPAQTAHTLKRLDPAAAHECVDRLQQFGFAGVTVEWVRGLAEPLQGTLHDLLESWENEYHAALCGEGDPFPTAVPAFLKAFDAATPEQTSDAAKLGAGAKIAGYKTTDNPYPPGTTLRAIWKEAFSSETFSETPTDASIQERTFMTPTHLNHTRTSARLSTDATTESIDASQREQRRHDYIEQLRTEIEESTELARETRSKLDRLDSDAQDARTAWNDSILKAETASEKLQLARAGIFPDSARNWPFPPDNHNSNCNLDSSWRNETNPRTRPTPRTQKHPDNGATFDLSSLQRGKLQKITDCDPEWGLSARQVERLKETVNGDTIAHLEKFQRDTFNWEQAIPGFGESTITKLQDAHLAFRIKYDMPESDESTLMDAASSNADPDSEQMTAHAIERLTKLIDLCEDVIDLDNSEDQQATEFCDSVALQASELRQQLITLGEVTTNQLRTIDSWLIAVENCGR